MWTLVSKDVVEGLLSSEYLHSRTCATYVSNVPIGKLLLNDHEQLPVPERLRTQSGTEKNLSKLNHDCSGLYRSEPDEIGFMVGAVDCFFRNPIKSTPFHTSSLYSEARSLLAELGKVYVQFPTDVQPSFLLFREVKLQGQPHSCTVKQIFPTTCLCSTMKLG